MLSCQAGRTTYVAPHWTHGGVTQRAEALADDVVADIEQQLQVRHLSLPVLNAAQDSVHPISTLAAGDALTTRLVPIKGCQSLRHSHNAGLLIDGDHRP